MKGMTKQMKDRMDKVEKDVLGKAKRSKHRKQQAVVPDWQFRGWMHGRVYTGLAELKRIGCCPAHYQGPRLGGVRPVEKRAAKIQKDYEDKMKKLDAVADAGLHHPRGR